MGAGEKSIRYVEGDATAPAGPGKKIIVHICNDVGKWGKGFVLALSRRWKEPEQEFRAAFRRTPQPVLGDVQFVRVSDSITVANVIGQHGIAADPMGMSPIRYEAVRVGLEKVAVHALKSEATVHMPRIGCGLAGGSWDKIGPIVEETLATHGIDVTVYDFGSPK
jgi:O-acetyl-ADP-ribose deacetylase (regulator of RNase III)